MQVEQDIPASVSVRVYVLGPLEIWKKDSAETWKRVTKDQWKNSKPARSVFKRLLVQPGRRLTRSVIEDDVWSEADNFELTTKNVYNAISLIRGILGKPLVTCWDAAYEIAGQTQVWTDLDASAALLKEAENRGKGTSRAVFFLEQAVALLERGELLEGEDGQWCHAFRKRAEDMLRYARLWLAEGYEAEGKLWQAGEQYRAMILTNPSDEDALQCWMTMLHRHGKTQEALHCYRDIKAFMEAQGFTLSPALEQAVLSLNRPPYTLLPPLQAGRAMEQPNREVRVLTESDVTDRLTALLIRPSSTGEVMYFEQQTRLYWRAREENVLSVTELYRSVISYMDSLTMALARASLPLVRQQLCATIGKTTLLAGMLLYDMGQYTRARIQYQIAFRAAIEAGNPMLQGIIWGWASFTWTYSRQYPEALHAIQYARHLASPTSDRLVHAWLAAIEAEIQAHMLNRAACMACLTLMDNAMDVTLSPDTAYLLEFHPVLLLGYKGVCLQRFYQQDAPETHRWLRDAKSALKSALASEAPPKRKLYYLIDLASAYARQGEVEKACASMAQSIPALMQMGGSKTLHTHVWQARALLQAYESAPSLQALDEQLHPLRLKE